MKMCNSAGRFLPSRLKFYASFLLPLLRSTHNVIGQQWTAISWANWESVHGAMVAFSRHASRSRITFPLINWTFEPKSLCVCVCLPSKFSLFSWAFFCFGNEKRLCASDGVEASSTAEKKSAEIDNGDVWGGEWDKRKLMTKPARWCERERTLSKQHYK